MNIPTLAEMAAGTGLVPEMESAFQRGDAENILSFIDPARTAGLRNGQSLRALALRRLTEMRGTNHQAYPRVEALGAIEAVVRCLQHEQGNTPETEPREHQPLIMWGVLFLSSLSEAGQTHRALRAGALPTLVALYKPHQIFGTRGAFPMAFSSLLRNAKDFEGLFEGRESLQVLDRVAVIAVGALAELVREKKDDDLDQVLAPCLECLGHLNRGCRELANTFVRLGGVKRVVAAMGVTVERINAQNAGLYALDSAILSNFHTIDDPNVKDRAASVLSGGGLAAAMAATRQYRDKKDTHLHLNAFSLFMSLTAIPDQMQGHVARVVKRVLWAMRHFQADVRVQDKGVIVLAYWVDASPVTGPALLADDEGITCVVRATRLNTRSTEAVERGDRLLRFLEIDKPEVTARIDAIYRQQSDIEHEPCSECGRTPAQVLVPRLLVCAGCTLGKGYCSKACQKAGWNAHKQECKANPKQV